jgi:hypothetical protein
MCSSIPLSETSPLWDSIDTFLRREDAERFIEEVPGDDPEIARHLRSRSGDARQTRSPR